MKHAILSTAALAPRLLGFISGILIAAAALLMTTDIILRSTRDRGAVGVVEIGEVGLVMIVMLAMVFTEYREAHVSSNILARYLSPKFLDVSLAVGLFMAAICMAWIAYNATNLAVTAWERGSIRPGLAKIPVWPARAAVALGFTLIAIQLTLKSIQLLVGSRNNKGQPPEETPILPGV